jgi:hypothetical protein
MSDSEITSSAGRYEVAVDTLLEFRKYEHFPGIHRLREIAKSREPMTIMFGGFRFTWHPGSAELLPTVTVPIQDTDDYEAERRAMERFLSALSFVFGYGITVYTAAGSGYKKEFDPPVLQQHRLKGVVHPAPKELVTLDDDELPLCLALLREGKSATSGALEFLSYWKVIEVAVGNKRKFKDWVGNRAHERWPEEEATPEAWFERLNATRVAAAHAIPWGEGTLRHDPDDPAIALKIRDNVGVAWELARDAITERWSNPVRQVNDWGR